MVTESTLQQRFSTAFYGNKRMSQTMTNRMHYMNSGYSADERKDTNRMAVPESLCVKVRAVLKKNEPTETV